MLITKLNNNNNNNNNNSNYYYYYFQVYLNNTFGGEGGWALLGM
jgi:hypothetical protein